ncbi:DMT family transporter [Inquilinus sp. Marseille-Q2685]|uniref:DMT family transporter n=1 Tax=Inquilinus sp. Marseille-Q2685 TaxID=2866581 RepID=UPI001CE45722|nr:DMT family transporter [Inquilinus sp. Marseille-Q2685]
METLFVPISLLAGGLLAVQAGANAQLAAATGSPFAATTLQLSVGTAILLAAALLTGTVSALAALPGVVWWHAVGGVASAVYVVSTILLFPRLGAVVSVGLFIAGQMLASLALDGFGLLGVPAAGFAPAALAGTALVLAGAAAIVLGQPGGSCVPALSRAGWILLALAAGAVLPAQGAVNALLRRDLGAPFAVGAVSFLVATAAMAAVLLLALALPRQPRPSLDGVAAMPWWGWLGGVAGATYVTTVFTAMPVIGAAAAVGLTVAGQQVASVFVDRHGWFRLPRRPVSALRLAGVAVLLAGVAVIKLG